MKIETKKQFMRCIAFGLVLPSLATPVTWGQSKGASFVLAGETDGLHKAAKADGGTYTAFGAEEPKGEAASLQALVAKSTFVFTCTVISASSELYDNGRAIQTVYRLTVLKSLEGTANTGANLAYQVPGGEFRFTDGTRAYYKVGSRKALLVGHRYLIFARYLSGKSGNLIGTAWDESAIELDSKHEAHSQAMHPTSITHQYAKMGEESLLKEVQGAIAEPQ